MGEVIIFPGKKKKETPEKGGVVDRLPTKNENIADEYYKMHRDAKVFADTLVKNTGQESAKEAEAGDFLFKLRTLELYFEDFMHWAHLKIPERGEEYSFHFAPIEGISRRQVVQAWMNAVQKLMEVE